MLTYLVVVNAGLRDYFAVERTTGDALEGADRANVVAVAHLLREDRGQRRAGGYQLGELDQRQHCLGRRLHHQRVFRGAMLEGARLRGGGCCCPAPPLAPVAVVVVVVVGMGRGVKMVRMVGEDDNVTRSRLPARVRRLTDADYYA